MYIRFLTDEMCEMLSEFKYLIQFQLGITIKLNENKVSRFIIIRGILKYNKHQYSSFRKFNSFKILHLLFTRMSTRI